MQFQTKGCDDLENCVEMRVALPRKRLIETFTRKARVASDLKHTLGARDVSEGLGNKSGIPSANIQ